MSTADILAKTKKNKNSNGPKTDLCGTSVSHLPEVELLTLTKHEWPAGLNLIKYRACPLMSTCAVFFALMVSKAGDKSDATTSLSDEFEQEIAVSKPCLRSRD